MEARALGRSGLRVSRVGLGTMSWGTDTDIHEARDILTAYHDAGGRFVDTSDGFGDGAAEEMLGELLRDTPDVVVSTKAGTAKGLRRRDASRAHLLASLDTSLRRLRRSHIDVWHIAAWDPFTPLDETMSALDHAVTSGKVRYAGISNFSGWQTATAAAHPGSTRLVSAQMEYSLVQRGVEREVLAAVAHHGLGLVAWSPLGRGVLTGKYRHATPSDSRGASTQFAPFVAPYLLERPRAIVEAVCTAADGLGLSPTHVALAWVTARAGVSSAVVGPRTAAHMRSLLTGTDATLPGEIHDALDEVSAPDRGYPEHGWSQL